MATGKNTARNCKCEISPEDQIAVIALRIIFGAPFSAILGRWNVRSESLSKTTTKGRIQNAVVS
jgi:hypothetical protein